MLISMGDSVTVKETAITKTLGFSGLVGTVFGRSTRVSSEMKVVGDSQNTCALNVYFDTLDKEVWFAEDLLEFKDHGEDQIITLEGSDRKWIRNHLGEWEEKLTS